MAQSRQKNDASRQRCARAAVPAPSAEPPRAVCAQLEQLNRKLAAASAEILRYQTRLFACERQMAALRQENAELEAACEQARQQTAAACAHAEHLQQELARHAEAVRPVPQTGPDAGPEEAQQGSEQPSAGPDWEPRTRLDHLSVELMNWFDDMMGA